MNLKEALNYLRVGLLQLPYSYISYETLLEAIELIESKSQPTPPTNTDKIKPCLNRDCNKNRRKIKKFSDDSSCSIFLKSAVIRCLNYRC